MLRVVAPLILLLAPINAQTINSATIPAAPVVEHNFWDRSNILLFSGVALFRGLDYASTRNMQARGREEILLPDDVVDNSAGFAALEAAGTGASVALSYWMHRLGHHKLERWVSITHIAVTGFGAARNYALKSKHPSAAAPIAAYTEASGGRDRHSGQN